MTSQIVAVTRVDLQRLQTLLQSEFAVALGGGRSHLTELDNALSRASVVESEEMVPDVVTMNSTVELLDLDRNDAETYTLVYPDEACIAEGKLSILSPLGAAVFGRRVGQSVSLHLLHCKTNKRVTRIYFQPERAGAFQL
ncbi:Regulator of nucleoside diphosphate kinase [Stieleria neptunia]|uniref:Regulator of nucleoside diphosphate kinase n=1 Tax=Stieleria neptunia TaxID=2527979 RepID=A0A518HKU6_9BACT|nr:GreA/GreB family elongation factor [Stieleria neptunia]QDV41467.1 Regulator of nucleoside diphosphate kinase [Stieleria neptunia]